ncbi:MAG: glutamate mutase L [Propionibacteriales bacterium]|nr:glutamate mutase L [Propionibacteriales bacterium]
MTRAEPATGLVVCVDFGSTFTKASLVDLEAGTLLATAQHRTTIESDVLDGYDACLADLESRHAGARDARTLACSSAGGGLRIAVLGNEALVTSEAGRRVALSSGGKVVHVGAGRLDDTGLAALNAAEPDVLLLTGGTDGGDADVLLHNAGWLEGEYWHTPVVVAGNVEAHEQVSRHLVEGGTPFVLADNVVPRIGVLAPESARRAIREVFLAHVIGGKHLSSRADFGAMVLGSTPDVVLTGVEALAAELGADRPGGGVVVVDIGGATTDVHSVVVLDPEEATLSREVVATTPVTRTVEGDLGMRWSAATTAAAAAEAGLDVPADSVRRAADPAYLPTDADETAGDEAIATAAAVLAMRRHVGRSRVVLSPEGRVVERSGKDLRAVDLLVGSGGVLRAADPETGARILSAATGADPDGWQLPEAPRIVVDTDYVLAAAGLIAMSGADGAQEQARRLVCNSLSAWR